MASSMILSVPEWSGETSHAWKNLAQLLEKKAKCRASQHVAVPHLHVDGEEQKINGEGHKQKVEEEIEDEGQMTTKDMFNIVEGLGGICKILGEQKKPVGHVLCIDASKCA